MSYIRILYVEHSEIKDVGGVKANIIELCAELAKRGHECTVITTNPKKKPHEEIYKNSKIIRINSPLSRYLFSFSIPTLKFLDTYLEEIKPDIVHLHSYRNLFTLSCAFMVKKHRIPMILSPHYDRFGYDTFAGKYLLGTYRAVSKCLFVWPHLVVANSNYSKRLMIEDLSIKPEKIVVIPHGTPRLDHIADGQRKKVKRDHIVLLSAGVLIKRKGIQHIISALPELKRLGKRAKLIIIGSGEYKAALKTIADEKGVTEMIEWYDPVPKETLYKKLIVSDIFLLVSWEESFGIIVAEALALGTPCIVTNTSALSDFLDNPLCFGIPYPPDPKELAALIVKVYNADIQAGTPHPKIPTWEDVAKDYEKIYEEAKGQ